MPLSKAELRKLKQVNAKKEKRESLSAVLAGLAASQLPDEQLALLRPVSTPRFVVLLHPYSFLPQ